MTFLDKRVRNSLHSLLPTSTSIVYKDLILACKCHGGYAYAVMDAESTILLEI